MSKPLSPDELGSFAAKIFPSFVFDAVNTLLATSANGKLYQNKIIDKMIELAAVEDIELTRSEIFDKHYLDFEEAYRSVGWEVFYDKPAYCESYEPNFTFKRKK